jgi:hypothetical protein
MNIHSILLDAPIINNEAHTQEIASIKPAWECCHSNSGVLCLAPGRLNLPNSVLAYALSSNSALRTFLLRPHRREEFSAIVTEAKNELIRLTALNQYESEIYDSCINSPTES